MNGSLISPAIRQNALDNLARSKYMFAFCREAELKARAANDPITALLRAQDTHLAAASVEFWQGKVQA